MLWLLGNAVSDFGVPELGRVLIILLGTMYLLAARVWDQLWFPQSSRQVPSWYTEGAPPGFFFFGAEMGSGLRTYSSTALPQLVALGVVTSFSGYTAVGAVLGFFAGRAFAIPIYHAARDPLSGMSRFRISLSVELLGLLGLALLFGLTLLLQ
jgi:hypothetical protein